MEMDRRLALAGVGALATTGLIIKPVGAKIATYSATDRSARISDVASNRTAYRTVNKNLYTQYFKIRIKNNYPWNLVFGIFGMVAPMEWRKTVAGSGGQYQNSNAEIRGGERVAIVWDDFSESILDFQWVLINGHVTVDVDGAGLMTIT
jgi:hypothetical protein